MGTVDVLPVVVASTGPLRRRLGVDGLLRICTGNITAETKGCRRSVNNIARDIADGLG